MRADGRGASSIHNRERRYATIMFVDLVGFTGSTAAPDSSAESALAYSEQVLQRVHSIVSRYGGDIHFTSGDGALCLFGLPAIDDPERRACTAAVRIHADLAENPISERTNGRKAQVRIGIDTGHIAIGPSITPGVTAANVIGRPVNYASRLQRAATPGSTLISSAVSAVAGPMFEFDGPQMIAVRGISERRPIYKLRAAKSSVPRFATSIARGLSSFIGRNDVVEGIIAGTSTPGSKRKVYAITGTAGIGKSRVIYETTAKLRNSRETVVVGECLPEAQDSPFALWRDALLDALTEFGFESDASQSLETATELLGVEKTRHMDPLLRVLGLAGVSNAFQQLDSVAVGDRLRDAVRAFFQRLGQAANTWLVLEDVHWIDGESLDLLNYFLEHPGADSYNILVTYRPDENPNAISQLNLPLDAVRYPLEPLEHGLINELVRSDPAATGMSSQLLERIVRDSGGNPLFAEELIDAGQSDRPWGQSAEVAFRGEVPTPARISYLVLAKKDSLSIAAQQVIAAASVAGSSFTTDLIIEVVDDPESVIPGLQAASERELVLEDPSHEGPGRRFIFRHGLIRRAIYDSIATTNLAHLHESLGDAIQARTGSVGEVADSLAYHYTAAIEARKASLSPIQGDLARKAATALKTAAGESLKVYALTQGLRYLESARELVEATADDEIWALELLPELLAIWTRILFFASNMKETVSLMDGFSARLEKAPVTEHTVRALNSYCFALWLTMRFEQLTETWLLAELLARQLGTLSAAAYARHVYLMAAAFLSGKGDVLREDLEKSIASSEPVSLVADVADLLDPGALVSVERVGRSLIAATHAINDAILEQNTYGHIAWYRLQRGQMRKAREAANEVRRIGIQFEDQRMLATASWLHAWISFYEEDYRGAISEGQSCRIAAKTPFDEHVGYLAVVAGEVLRVREQQDAGRDLSSIGPATALQDDKPVDARTLRAEVDSTVQEFEKLGLTYAAVAAAPIKAATLALEKRVAASVGVISGHIHNWESRNYGWLAGLSHLALARIYVEIATASGRPDLGVLFRNFVFLLRTKRSAEDTARVHIEQAMKSNSFDGDGVFMGRALMLRARLDAFFGNSSRALEDLGKARVLFADQDSRRLVELVDVLDARIRKAHSAIS